MPRRSSTSRVLVWPARAEVLAALSAWTQLERAEHPEIVRIGYFGSLAHGGYGVGSDADVVIVVRKSARPQWERPLDFHPRGVPVGVDLLVYTDDEWREVVAREDRFGLQMRSVVWL